jgi:hypothetical protein
LSFEKIHQEQQLIILTFSVDLVQALLMELGSGMEREIPGRQTLDKKEK